MTIATYIPQKTEDSVAASADLAVPILAVRNDAAASKTDADGDYSMLATDAAGRVGITTLGGTLAVSATATDLDIRNLVFATDKVDASGSTGVGVTGTFFQATQPVSAASLPLPSGAATLAGQTQPGVDIGDVTINNASGGSAVNIQDGSNSITIDAVSLPLPSGASTLAGQTQPGVDIGDVTINNASGGSAVNIQDGGNSITVDAPVGTPAFVTTTPSTTGGWDTFMATSADGSTALTATAQAIKASAGTFGGYFIYNPNATAIYVHIYNVAAASVTVGTTNPKNTFVIPATSGANLEISNGIQYGTAMSTAATTTGGGLTAPTTALEANFWYK